jgi:hypothetical protein
LAETFRTPDPFALSMHDRSNLPLAALALTVMLSSAG